MGAGRALAQSGFAAAQVGLSQLMEGEYARESRELGPQGLYAPHR